VGAAAQTLRPKGRVTAVSSAAREIATEGAGPGPSRLRHPAHLLQGLAEREGLADEAGRPLRSAMYRSIGEPDPFRA